jgi:hypothetical protein
MDTVEILRGRRIDGRVLRIPREIGDSHLSVGWQRQREKIHEE